MAGSGGLCTGVQIDNRMDGLFHFHAVSRETLCVTLRVKHFVCVKHLGGGVGRYKGLEAPTRTVEAQAGCKIGDRICLMHAVDSIAYDCQLSRARSGREVRKLSVHFVHVCTRATESRGKLAEFRVEL